MSQVPLMPMVRDRTLEMSLQMLRDDLPEWSWRATRHGMRWRYEGHRDEDRVTLIAHAAISGPLEDDYTTRWMVFETGETYVVWYQREIARLRKGET